MILNFILLLVVFLSFATTQGLSSNLPADPEQKRNYQIAAATFGILGYGLLLFLMYKEFKAGSSQTGGFGGYDGYM